MAVFTGLPQIPSPDHIYFQLFLIAREVVKSQMKFTAHCTSLVTALWQCERYPWLLQQMPAQGTEILPFREAAVHGYLLLYFTNIYTRSRKFNKVQNCPF